MAIIGSSITLSKGSYTLTINEQSFVELTGYTKSKQSKPNIEMSIYGSPRYKQSNLPYPLHSFNFDVVISEADALALYKEVENHINEYKNNTNRVVSAFELSDNRIKTCVIPLVTRVSSIGNPINVSAPAYAYLRHNIMFKEIRLEEFSSSLTRVLASATELLL